MVVWLVSLAGLITAIAKGGVWLQGELHKRREDRQMHLLVGSIDHSTGEALGVFADRRGNTKTLRF